jgi:hypothetical protein
MTLKATDSIAPFTQTDGTNTAPTTNTCSGDASLDTTARAAALGSGYPGNFLRVRPVGAAVRWLVVSMANGVTPTAANFIDNTQATHAAGLQFNTKIGSYVPDGVEVERELPGIAPGNVLWFIWQGLAAGTFVQVEKGSGKPGQNTDGG